MTVASVAVATTEFLFDMCNCITDSDIGMGNFSLMLGILHMCGHTHVSSRVSLSTNYNLCQKSWNTYVSSGDHLVVSPSPPQNNVDVYSVDRYRNSRYACRHFSDK